MPGGPAPTPSKATTSSWLFPPTTQEVQLDEQWSFVGKKQKHCSADESRCVDCWDHVALDADSRLVLSVVVGKRTEANSMQVVYEMRERTEERPLNLITTDEYPAYATALATLYAEPGPAAVPAATTRQPALATATAQSAR